MKHICLNLKRFDVPVSLGGVNRIAPAADWGAYIVERTEEALHFISKQNRRLEP